MTGCRRPVTHHHPAGSGTRARDVFWQTQLRTPVWLQQAAKQFFVLLKQSKCEFLFTNAIKISSFWVPKKNSTWIRSCGLMSPAVVASRLDYQNKLVPIDRVLHALKSCRLGRIDRNHHGGGWVILISKVKTQWKVGKKVQSKCRRNKKCVAVLAAQFKWRVVG